MFFEKKKLPLYICSALVFVSLFDELLPGLRYAKYLIPPVCLLFFCIFPNIYNIKSPYLLAFYLYISIISIYLVASAVQGLGSNLSDLYFILSYMAPFVISRKNVRLEQYFYAVALIFIVVSLTKLGGPIVFNPLSSLSTFEHHELGFIFGLFNVYFISSKKYKLALCSLVLALLALKRVALIGTLVALLVFYVKDAFIYRRYYVAVIMGLLNVLFVGGIKFATTDTFDSIITESFGMSANQLLMGRVTLYSYILSHVEIHWLYGGGPGAVYNFASVAFDSSAKVLLHSDILKISIEYGLLFGFFFFFLLYLAPKRHVEYIVYFNVLMISDNPLIYSSVMFFLLLIIHNGRAVLKD